MIYKDFNNINIENCPGVYPVREPTKTISRALAKLNFKNFESALEIGCGTGFVAIYLSTLGFKCDASDINDKAVECAKKNALRNNIQVDFFVSDLFENIKRKYDLIIFNPPVANFQSKFLENMLNLLRSAARRIKHPLILNMYYHIFKGQRIRLVKRFLNDVNRYLLNNGKVVITLIEPYEPYLIKGVPYKILGCQGNLEVFLLSY